MNTLLERRRLMMQTDSSTINGYIKRGLVFYLDGIDKGANDGTWVDLIGGVVFSAVRGTPVSREKSWYFSNGATFGSNYNGLNFTNFTIELCAELTADNIGGAVFFNNFAYANTPYPFLMERTGSVYQQKTSSSGNNRRFYSGKLQSLKIISMQTDIIVVNGQEYTTVVTGGTDGQPNTSTTLAIGSRNGAYKIYGNIYCIRIYNRQLSLEEMFQNQQNDNIRFELGI